MVNILIYCYLKWSHRYINLVVLTYKIDMVTCRSSKTLFNSSQQLCTIVIS